MSKELENVTIIAPDEEVANAGINIELGSYDVFEVKVGGESFYYTNKYREGHWIQYENGLITNVMRGIWSRISQKFEEDYLEDIKRSKL